MLRTIFVIAAIVAAIIPNTSTSAERFDDPIFEACLDDQGDAELRLICDFYISGFVSGVIATAVTNSVVYARRYSIPEPDNDTRLLGFCLPQNVSSGEYWVIVRTYLRRQVDDLPLSMNLAILAALSERFGCDPFGDD